MNHNSPNNNSSSSKPSRTASRLTEMLDHVERRVELLRDHTAAMEQERDALLSMIQTIQTNKDLNCINEGEREEIQVAADRLMGRLLSVEVSVSTPRNENQQKALEKVNKMIDDLLVRLNNDVEGTRRMLEVYLNTCSTEATGPIDHRFQAAVIECTADDQKKTKRRLETLMSSIVNSRAKPKT